MHLICTKLYNVYKNVKSGNPLAQPTSTLLKHVLLIGGGPCLPGIGSQVSTITVKYFKDTEHVKMEKSQPAVENIRLELAMAPTYSMLPYRGSLQELHHSLESIEKLLLLVQAGNLCRSQAWFSSSSRVSKSN